MFVKKKSHHKNPLPFVLWLYGERLEDFCWFQSRMNTNRNPTTIANENKLKKKNSMPSLKGIIVKLDRNYH